MLSLNMSQLETRFNGSEVTLTTVAKEIGSLWQVQSSLPDRMHIPKYPVRMDIEASPTRPENVELRCWEIAESFLVAARWYESVVRYMLGRPERFDEHPATNRAKKQVAAASTRITMWFNENPLELVAG